MDTSNRELEVWLARALLSLEGPAPEDKEAMIERWRANKPEYLRRARRLMGRMSKANIELVQHGAAEATEEAEA